MLVEQALSLVSNFRGRTRRIFARDKPFSMFCATRFALFKPQGHVSEVLTTFTEFETMVQFPLISSLF